MHLVEHSELQPNGLPISCRKRAIETVKIAMISRAKRSAAWACSAAASGVASLAVELSDEGEVVSNHQSLSRVSGIAAT